MAYYYVKNGGAATSDAGRYATQQTGSFAALGASGYYNDVVSAIAATTSPVSGDFICVSDLHSYNYGGVTVNYTGTSPTPFYIVAVDDLNIDVGRLSSNRPFEDSGGTSGASDIVLRGVFVSGMSLNVGDDISILSSSILHDSKLRVSGSDDKVIFLNSDGASGTYIDCEFAMDDAGAAVTINSGGTVAIEGGGITTTAAGVDNFINGGATTGGMSLSVKGSDFSVVTGALISNVGGDEANDDAIDVHFDLVKIASGVAFTNEEFKSHNQRALFTRCSDSSAAAEYQYHLHAFGGDVDDDSSIFRNEDEPFTESNQKISYKIVTNSDASLGSPLWLDFPVLRYSKLSLTASDTLRFYLTSNAALTNKDIYIEVSYPDGTNKQTPNFLSSAPVTVGGTLDLMATGTTLATDSISTYTGGLTNKYQIDIDTSVNAGADCQPIVKVYITKPSVTIHIASEFGLS